MDSFSSTWPSKVEFIQLGVQPILYFKQLIRILETKEQRGG